MKRFLALIMCALLLAGVLPAGVAEEIPEETAAAAEEPVAGAEEAPREAAPEAESAEAPEGIPAEAPEEGDDADPEGLPSGPEGEAAPAEEELPAGEPEVPAAAEELSEEASEAAWPAGMTVENGVLTKYTGSAASLTIPSGITAIGLQAFAQNTALQSVTFSSGVKEIQASAFAYCSNLRTIALPSTLEWIGGYAFRATALTDVTIPSRATEIYDGAFMNCIHLTKITIPESVFYIADNAFEGHCSGLKIYGKSGSSAETFANSQGIGFVATGTNPLPEVISVSLSADTVRAGKPLTLTVKTPSRAKFLALYAEYNTKVKSWSATGNSTVSGDTRTWTVQYTFNNSGDRTLDVRCSESGTYGAGKSFSVKVTPGIYAVSSAGADVATVPAKVPVTFTVKTPVQAIYLALYAENGAKVKAWGKTNNSTVSSSVRTWKIQYALNGTGDRKVTFKCSAGSSYGSGKTVAIRVTAAQPEVSSVSVQSQYIQAGETATFTVKTPTSANYVAMFAENGKKVKVWGKTGNSTVSGGTRVWTLKYAIASSGARHLTFKASANGTYGNGKTVNFYVL